MEDLCRKWTEHVSSNRIKAGMTRGKAEQLLAAKLIVAKAVSAEEIWAYYELDPQCIVCVHYAIGSSSVFGSPTLLPNGDEARTNLARWAAK